MCASGIRASRFVVVKDGADPTTVLPASGGAITVPVRHVAEVRDLTAAGDAFAAGFLSAYLRGSDLRQASLGGHDMAARVLSAPGAEVTGHKTNGSGVG